MNEAQFIVVNLDAPPVPTAQLSPHQLQFQGNYYVIFPSGCTPLTQVTAPSYTQQITAGIPSTVQYVPVTAPSHFQFHSAVGTTTHQQSRRPNQSQLIEDYALRSGPMQCDAHEMKVDIPASHPMGSPMSNVSVLSQPIVPAMTMQPNAFRGPEVSIAPGQTKEEKTSLSVQEVIDTKKWSNAATLDSSSSVASGSCRCSFCGKTFQHESNLLIHLKIHSPDALQCSFCGKKFARHSNLRQHLRVHTNERPFHCKYCPKSFKQQHR